MQKGSIVTQCIVDVLKSVSAYRSSIDDQYIDHGLYTKKHVRPGVTIDYTEKPLSRKERDQVKRTLSKLLGMRNRDMKNTVVYWSCNDGRYSLVVSERCKETTKRLWGGHLVRSVLKENKIFYNDCIWKDNVYHIYGIKNIPFDSMTQIYIEEMIKQLLKEKDFDSYELSWLKNVDTYQLDITINEC